MGEKEPNIYQNAQGDTTEPQEPGTRVERMADFSEETLQEILSIERACFEGDMVETEEEIRPILTDPTGIHLKLMDSEGRMVGYVTSLVPYQESEELQKTDPEFKAEEGVLYVHSIDILPGSRNLKNFNALFRGFEHEVMKDEHKYRKIITYARTTNRFSSILQKKFGARCLRTIDNWRDSGETMDYLEIDLPKQEK